MRIMGRLQRRSGRRRRKRTTCLETCGVISSSVIVTLRMLALLRRVCVCDETGVYCEGAGNAEADER